MTIEAFPLRHISVRVPWHDSGWNGTVCRQPGRNTACLKLPNIAESKDETTEAAIAGKSIQELKQAQYPPCVTERGMFMAPFPIERLHEHPYVKRGNKTHTHFKPTPLRYPAYSVAGLPFRWMQKEFVFGNSDKGIVALKDLYPLEAVSQDNEPKLGFETAWLQDHRNHRAMLECFWKHVRKQESLVFFYAKQVPLVEDTGRRVIIGVGRVLDVGKPTEYVYDGSTEGKLRSLLWECLVSHSIRPDFKDGFLMPYHEALLKSDDGRAFDPVEVVALAPEDRFDEFSYATEHVSHDAAISSLLACRAALLRASELFTIDIKKQEEWIDKELGRLWKKRGPFPGLGAVLSAMGMPLGNFVAQHLVDKVGDEGNPWPALDAALADPAKHLPRDLSRHLDDTLAKAWKRMPKARRAFLELLSRIDFSLEQAEVLVNPEERSEWGIDLPDSAFLENPYLIYEATRGTLCPVEIGTVDRGLLPAPAIRDRFPIPEPTVVKNAVDARRLRALAIRELEQAAVQGDTLRTREDVILAIRRREETQTEARTPVTGDLMAVAEEDLFAGEISLVNLANGEPAYQLQRYTQYGEIIRTAVLGRINGRRHALRIEWRKELDKALPKLPESPEDRAIEEHAREEKAASLAEISASRFSVLIGPAGTGKTTLLSVLCQRPEIHTDGVLLLAPTGKARVRMESIARNSGIQNYKAFTLAQFLSASGRYDGDTFSYRPTGDPKESGSRTVIVDECSMLTEEMMAALLDAISTDRLIFVGDPRQLPPIGAGRPFVDIVTQLKPEGIDNRFPKVGQGYAELTIPRRQGAGDRADLQLASWFGGVATAPGEDQVFEILAGNRQDKNIRFIRWETPDELEQCLPKVLAESLSFLQSEQEWQAFAKSLGGVIDEKGSAWFNVKWGDRPSAGEKAEAWQILSPVRQKPWGVDPINRLIHVRYKRQQIDVARNPGKYRNIPKPMGDAQIIYGDKVINNRNWSVWKKRIYPEPAQAGYLANGEIGMVVGHRRTQKKSWNPDYMEVEFSTQVGKVFKFYDSDFDPDGEANLELAYALTVHKAQGSEFGIVFLILPRSPLMLTRELLYTALTRQKDRVIVLHQGSATDLHKLSRDDFSATARRLTNLFRAPSPIQVGKAFLEERLIHVTSRGELVRSKSEVIIANLLDAYRIDYAYERELKLSGAPKFPDFTIVDDNAGITYYWEHCGMMHDPAYRRRWAEKLRLYRENGILPHDEGGGERGTLIVTEDGANGGISSQEIKQMILTVIQGQGNA